MQEKMTKDGLKKILRKKRAEWENVLARVPVDRMAEPGVDGEWSVKDIIAHLTYYERWIADRFEEQLHGSTYTPSELDFMGEARNETIFQRNRSKPLEAVLEESKLTYKKLMDGLQALPESFLIEPQVFQGAPQPVIVWMLLRSEVYEHYGKHIPSIENWLVDGKGTDGSGRSDNE